MIIENNCALYYLCSFKYIGQILDFLIERDPVVNTFISLPKDKSSLNCASFIAGIIEAFLAVIHYLYSVNHSII